MGLTPTVLRLGLLSGVFMPSRKRIDPSARRQVQLGRQLAAQKKICVANGQTWCSYVKDNCEFSRERADELIRIGLGLLPIEASRDRKRKSQRKTRSSRRAPAQDMIQHQVEQTRYLSRRIVERWHATTVAKTELDKTRKAIEEAISVWKELLDILPL